MSRAPCSFVRSVVQSWKIELLVLCTSVGFREIFEELRSGGNRVTVKVIDKFFGGRFRECVFLIFFISSCCYLAARHVEPISESLKMEEGAEWN